MGFNLAFKGLKTLRWQLAEYMACCRVEGIDLSLFWESHETSDYTLWAKRRFDIPGGFPWSLSNHFSLIKPTDALISQIYFVKKLYMFRAVPLPIIRSFPLYIRHWFMSCRFDDSFQARPEWSCLKAVNKTCMTYTSAECTAENSWWMAEELPETCRVSWQNKIGKLVRLLVLLKEIFYDARLHERKNLFYVKFNNNFISFLNHF